MGDSKSETDSDEDISTGNVARLVLRPAGHTGKAKRGHLCFDASFESGNLGRINHINEYEFDLFIRSDSCNPRFRFWFNFTVDNVRNDQRVLFNIVNFSKSQTLFRDGLTPLVKSTSRPEWVRVLPSQVFYRRSPEHDNGYVLSMAFAFDREEDVYQFALSFPYTYSRLQSYLDILEEKRFSFFKREILTLTLHKRNLDMITITNPRNLEQEDVKQKTVFIIARLHPGESPTSFVAQGIIDFLLSENPIAKELREYIVFKIIPMANPDGVYLGNYRCSLIGADLNRKWQCISEWAHPEIHAIKSIIAELDRGKTASLEFVLDLHAHPGLYGTFIYGNSYSDFLRLERHLLFPKLLSKIAPDYVGSNCCFNKDSAKAGTARRYLSGFLKEHVNVYTLNCSLYGYPADYDGLEIIPYTQESYSLLGRNLAQTFHKYYRLTNHIPPPPKERPLRPKGWLKPRSLSRTKKTTRQDYAPLESETENSGTPSESESSYDDFANFNIKKVGGRNRLDVEFNASDSIHKDAGSGNLCTIYAQDSDEPVVLKKGAFISPGSSPSFRNRRLIKETGDKLRNDLVIDVKAARRKRRSKTAFATFPIQKPTSLSSRGILLKAPIVCSSSESEDIASDHSQASSPETRSGRKILSVVDFSSLARCK
ncbi:cytosolic carboxypeptidase 6-like isoform X2 [Artemia franciscana]|uniref:cytosolic carboxypeptidase 6-like isoform X2 n=1 Tax=Artemia franciscana TaxID=6661 RepID=UPI0032DA5F00